MSVPEMRQSVFSFDELRRTLETFRNHVNDELLRVTKRVATGVNYTALPADQYIGVTADGVTVTLHTAVGYDRKVVIVKDESGAASGSGITVDGAGAELIDGGATATIGTDYGSLTLVSNNVQWFTI